MSSTSSPSRSQTITVVGHVCIDENTDVATRDGHTGASVPVRRTAGSSPVFMNRHWQQLANVDVAVIAPFGVDFLEIDSTLPLLNGPTAVDTMLYRNHIDGPVRRQECVNADRAEPVPIDARAAARLGSSDLVVVCPLLPNFDATYIESVLGHTAALSVLLAQGHFRRVSADGSVGTGPFIDDERVIPLFDVVILSDEDTDDAVTLARAWSERFPGTTIVVTQNSNGATYFQAGIVTRMPTRALAGDRIGNVVGAGDVFAAALAVGYLVSGSIHTAVAGANTVAADFVEAQTHISGPGATGDIDPSALALDAATSPAN
ncbi:carbohydrate kinase family protein [Marisediminicola senii]|uniref:carbohydrate kinase family protein n=1 Tax=Marisediminicola senii TaxID=2711233 RepID=UPI0013EBFD2F|nr:carbohydrate kinase family protein [Marisediminicola senii]